MNQERKIITAKEDVIGGGDGSYTRDELIAYLDECIAGVKDNIGEIKFHVELEEKWYAYEDRPTYRGVLEMYYQRLENDGEYNTRIETENKRRAAQEAHEKAEFERLRSKYGK